MTGTREFSKLDNSAVKLTVKLSKEEVNSEYNRIVKDFLKELQMPGFRRGKVPREVLERKAGDSLKEDVLDQIIGKLISETLNDENCDLKYKPLGLRDPEVAGKPKLDLENELEFAVTYDVFPEIKLEKIEGFEVEVPQSEITEEDIALELENIRDRNAIVMEREEGEPAQKGDVVTLDFCELNEDGSENEATKRSYFTFTIGTGHNHYQIDDEVIGMKVGEKKSFEKEYPADFKESDLAGRKITIQVEMRTIKEKKLPELDDDLAQDVSEKFNTLDDLKNDIKEKLEENLKIALIKRKKEALLDKLVEANPIILPESMVDNEVRRRFFEVFGQYATKPEQVEKFMTPFLVDGEKPEAKKRLSQSFIMSELIKQNNIDAGDEEIDAQINEWAEKDGDTSEEHKQEIKNDSAAMKEARNIIVEKKLFDFIESKNIIKQGEKIKYIDLLNKK